MNWLYILNFNTFLTGINNSNKTYKLLQLLILMSTMTILEYCHMNILHFSYECILCSLTLLSKYCHIFTTNQRNKYWEYLKLIKSYIQNSFYILYVQISKPFSKSLKL